MAAFTPVTLDMTLLNAIDDKGLIKELGVKYAGCLTGVKSNAARKALEKHLETPGSATIHLVRDADGKYAIPVPDDTAGSPGGSVGGSSGGSPDSATKAKALVVPELLQDIKTAAAEYVDIDTLEGNKGRKATYIPTLLANGWQESPKKKTEAKPRSQNKAQTLEIARLEYSKEQEKTEQARIQLETLKLQVHLKGTQ